jgi:hypothetical protein
MDIFHGRFCYETGICIHIIVACILLIKSLIHILYNDNLNRVIIYNILYRLCRWLKFNQFEKLLVSKLKVLGFKDFSLKLGI